jgi:hypothetical protein
MMLIFDRFSVPFLGGELAQSMGFPAIMRILGFLNFIYGPVLLFVTMRYNLNVSYIFDFASTFIFISFS